MDLSDYRIELVFPEEEKAEILKEIQGCYIRCVLAQIKEKVKQDGCPVSLAELYQAVVQALDSQA